MLNEEAVLLECTNSEKYFSCSKYNLESQCKEKTWPGFRGETQISRK
jgi:hypothetical protein